MSEYKFKLYSYWRSSCSWRVRIVLALKNIDYEYIPVPLLEKKHQSEEYTKLNSMQEVPTLIVIHPDGTETAISQSFAIVDYLNTIVPEKSIFPVDPVIKAKSLAIALDVISGIQPIQNLKVGQYVNQLMNDNTQMAKWANHFITQGLHNLEQKIDEHGPYAIGTELSFADMCIIPQLYNARRFKVDLTVFPKLLRVEQACEGLPSFQKAHPDAQPDAAPQ